MPPRSEVVSVYLFRCPFCEHRNRPSTKVRECVRLWLLDQLPQCKKCGHQLRKEEFLIRGWNVESVKQEIEKAGESIEGAA